MRLPSLSPRRRILPAAAAIAVIAVALVGCGTAAKTSTTPTTATTATATTQTTQTTPTTAHAAPSAAVRSGHVTVAITNYAFAPKSLTVRAGTRVTWTNHDATAHTATADGGAFDTGTINPKHSKTVDLSKPGTYAYHCVFHAFMTATIRVVG